MEKVQYPTYILGQKNSGTSTSSGDGTYLCSPQTSNNQ